METANPPQRINWGLQLLGLWLIVAVLLVAFRWQNIQFLILADTDDNLRLAQVKAWLGGQGWYDLRQYKLDPPGGADIHWSRLPDLPIAGIMAVLSPLMGALAAEKFAIALAPLFPLGLAMLGIALVARRLLGAHAMLFAVVLLCTGSSVLGMFLPTRIDHHGWQLGFLALVLAGLADPVRRRGGLTAGFATAASLSVGLEMLPYLGLCGALLGVRWLFEEAERERLRAYGLSLAGGTLLGFAAFASEANWAPRCDALTPVWLSTMTVAGVLLAGLSAAPLPRLAGRFAAAAFAAAVLAAGFVYFWPQCLGRPEGLSDVLYRDWFLRISEVRPLSKLDLKTALGLITLPIFGLLGCLMMLWRDRVQRAIWAQCAVLVAGSIAMLFWQMRAGPAAQLLALPGASALMMAFALPLSRSPKAWVRILGPVAAFVTFSGMIVPLGAKLIPESAPEPKATGVSVVAKARRASAQCETLSALRPIARQTPGTIFTLVDLGPRLVAMTPHKAIAGPYHRNGKAILDVFTAFRKSPDVAQIIIRAHYADYVLICPGMAEGNNHLRAGPNGFLAQLQNNRIPNWLTEVPLPATSPFRMWRVKPLAGHPRGSERPKAR